MATKQTTKPTTTQKPATSEPVNLPATGFIRLHDLVKFVPFGKSTIWRKVKAKDFPAPVKLSERITAWQVEDIREWIDQHARATV